MTATPMTKPCRLEFNNSGSWKLLGKFDAADDEQTSLVLDAAEVLVKTLHNSEDPNRCPTLRVSIDTPGDTTMTTIAHWSLVEGWRDAETGKPV